MIEKQRKKTGLEEERENEKGQSSVAICFSLTGGGRVGFRRRPSQEDASILYFLDE